MRDENKQNRRPGFPSHTASSLSVSTITGPQKVLDAALCSGLATDPLGNVASRRGLRRAVTFCRRRRRRSARARACEHIRVPPLVHARTHTLAVLARTRARIAAQPLVDRPVAPTCRVGGPSRFFRCRRPSADRPSRRRQRRRRWQRRRRRVRVVDPETRSSARVRARERNARENRTGRARARARDRWLARVYVKRTPCQGARRVRGAESRVKPAGLPKLGEPARNGGSCEAARRDSPRENSAGNQTGSTPPREACGETFRVQTTACTHGDGGAATRRDAARRRRRRDAAGRDAGAERRGDWVARLLLSFSLSLSASPLLATEWSITRDFQHRPKRV